MTSSCGYPFYLSSFLYSLNILSRASNNVSSPFNILASIYLSVDGSNYSETSNQYVNQDELSAGKYCKYGGFRKVSMSLC